MAYVGDVKYLQFDGNIYGIKDENARIFGFSSMPFINVLLGNDVILIPDVNYNEDTGLLSIDFANLENLHNQNNLWVCNNTGEYILNMSESEYSAVYSNGVEDGTPLLVILHDTAAYDITGYYTTKLYFGLTLYNRITGSTWLHINYDNPVSTIKVDPTMNGQVAGVTIK